MNTKNLISNIIESGKCVLVDNGRHNYTVLAVALVFMFSGVTTYTYHHYFDKQSILIAQSIAIEKEKLESEGEMKSLEQRIATYNSIAAEHNDRAKQIMGELSSYIKAQKASKPTVAIAQTTSKLWYTAPIVFVLLGVILLLVNNYILFKKDFVKMDRKAKMRIRNFVPSFLKTHIL